MTSIPLYYLIKEAFKIFPTCVCILYTLHYLYKLESILSASAVLLNYADGVISTFIIRTIKLIFRPNKTYKLDDTNGMFSIGELRMSCVKTETN